MFCTVRKGIVYGKEGSGVGDVAIGLVLISLSTFLLDQKGDESHLLIYDVPPSIVIY